MKEAIDILDTMISELVAKQDPHGGIESNYTEIEDQIEVLREGIIRIEKAMEGKE